MYDPASMPLFRLEVARLRQRFPVLWLRGTEAISQPFEFELEIIDASAALDPASLMYKTAFLGFGGSGHGVHGQIHEVMRSHHRPGPAYYRLKIGPRLACLGMRFNQRVFENLSSQQIIARVLEEHGLRKGMYRFDLKAERQTRELCIQYDETDLQLVERLCVEDGIHFHFIHSRHGHELIFGDGLRGFGRAPVAPWRHMPRQAGVTRFAVTRCDQNRQDSRAGELAQGTSTLPFVSAGQLLPLVGHPAAEWNHMWLVTRVEHRAALPDPKKRSGEPYINRFDATPWEIDVSPATAYQRPPAPAMQRAWVMGPTRQQASRDSKGRVQVQFEWSRQGQGSRYSDCWLSLAPGLDVPLKAGMAVAVSFLEGNMDRPMIVGSLAAPTFAETASTAADPARVTMPDSLHMHLDWRMLLGDERRLRLEGGPTLHLDEHSELTVAVGASRCRFDASGLSLDSPRVAFTPQATPMPEPEPNEPDPAATSALEPGVRTGKAPGNASQADPSQQSEGQEGQP